MNIWIRAAQNHLEWTPNTFAYLQFYVHNVELSPNDEFKPNADDKSLFQR